MLLTNFNGAGVGFGFGAGCGFGVGWGFGADGTAFGSQYHSSGVTCQGIDFGKKEHDDAVQKSNQDIRASRWLFVTPFPHHFRV